MPYSMNGSKNDLYPEQIRFEEDKVCRSRTSLEKCLIPVVILLFLLSLTLAALFAVYYIKAQDNDSNTVCTSRDCVATASMMASKMDVTSDPCQDFAQYACGGFYRDTIIPDNKDKVTSFSLVNDKNNLIIRTIMEAPESSDEKSFVKKMKNNYKNCMDVDTIEVIGLAPYKTSRFASEWPTLNPSWDPATFDLNDVIEKYEREFVEPVFIYVVSTNPEDSSQHKLHVSQPSLSLPLKYMKLPRNDSTLMAFQKYYQDFAIELGADPDTAKRDAKDIVDFEVALAKVLVTREESLDINTINNPTTLQNMTSEYPFIDFHRAIQAAFDAVDRPIPEDLDIINRHPKYFRGLSAVLDATDNRIIMNRFGYLFAKLNVGSLTKNMRAIRAEFVKVITGKKEQDPRWRQCLTSTTYFVADAVGKAFVQETFSEDSKEYMDTMIVNLRTAFAGLLEGSSWMKEKTKKAAFLKLDNMGRKIGYPDNNFSDEYIETKYENYTVYKGEYYRTIMEAYKHKNMEGLRLLGKSVDKERWAMLPSEVNAYYSATHNEIGFPAGILQPPFFSEQAPSSVNYGAIGAIIGHEITHGFDHSGSQFDHLGNLKNWWQEDDLKDFKNRTQCVTDHYGDFEVKDIGMKLNGKLTAGENTADIGGLKESYRAYKTYSANQPEEIPLPGMGLTADQQFFLAFAQLWCSKLTKAEMKDSILSGVHSPGRFRIIGSFHNNEEFPRVFNCPVGSPMNPAKKCVVW